VSLDIVSVSSPIPTQAIPTDITPDLDVDEPDVTDSEAPYGYTPTGRVRKRPTGSRKNATRQAGASNEKLARQAAKTLVQTHGIIAIPLILVGLTETAAALTDEQRNDLFEEQVYSALLTDPALCRSILKGGGTSGKIMLLIAYVMFGAGVGAVAIPEVRELQAARRTKKLNVES
jgi:hypothetical protein